ncbi:hypothetical protein sos41_04510 [Alphaproteobacteria bacterium SO-S41]|nr:hypothetical protein sos41_04510 [Alphaproteobacteria bacterium SO-S41]
MPKPLRIFISSPGDVSAERRRSALVVESLKKEFARFFDITAYLWEHEAMLATGHFQDVIEPPSQSDIVVLILWSRLGTPLPVNSGKREYRGLDGRAPVTGTEWEYEDALAANRDKGAPDLLVYRSNREPQISLRDPQKKQLAENQWTALEDFWSRYFQAGGVFLSAYHGFDDLEDFGDMLEAHLRQLIRSRIEKGRIEAGSDVRATWMQSPFRGLSSYEFEHAPIFFGRGAAQLKAVEQVVKNANEGKAFLLVLGASGSGKSSLVRAGLLPNLFARGVADGAGLWRRAIFKPGDADGNLFLGLARTLTEDRVKEGVGLPEILGPGVTLEQLENALRRSVDDPGFVFTPALGKVSSEARAAGKIMGHESAKLALVLDQLEEIFTDASISTEERNTFIRLIGSLAKSGQVWVIATMRSDFWHKAAASPELVALAEGLGRMDLLPPSQAELAEMIRRPAAAAGLSFEDHSETRVGLDGVIAEEASRDPGSLPLVSFMLDALYKTDVEKSKGAVLTYGTYEALGGIKGAIATRADEILNAQPADVQAALPSVLRALVTVDSDRDQNATARTAPLNAFPAGSPRRALVDAFLDPAARLLIADGDGGEARIRVAHEALINHWTRAREQINRDRRDLETRTRLEEDEQLWRAAPAAEKPARLLEGLALEEGKDLVVKWSDELPQSLKDYIEESRKTANLKRNRRTRILTAVAAVMAVLAIGAGVLGIFALRQEALAQAESERAQAESERAKSAEDQAEERLKDTQRGSARLVARQSYLASHGGYSELALALAVESVRIAQQAGGELPLASLAALQHAASTDTIVSVLADSNGSLGALSFGADPGVIYTGGNGTLTVWNTFLGTERAFFGTNEVGFVTSDADDAGHYLVNAYNDKTLQVFDASTFETVGNMLTFDAGLTMVEIDRNGREILVADDAGAIHFIDAATQQPIASEKAHDAPLGDMKIADNLSIAVTADSAGKAVIWDLATHTQRAVIYHGTQESPSAITGVAISPSGNQVILIGNGYASVYDSAGTFVQQINIDNAFLYRVVYTPDGSSVIYTAGKNAYAARSSDFVVTKTFSGHTFDVRELSLSSDGKRMLTAAGDNTLRLWDVDSASTLRIYRSPKGSIATGGLSLSSDGNYVAAVFDDGNAVVWAVEGLSPASARVVHDWNINSIVWSPDGQYVLTTANESAGGRAVLSDVETGHPEFSLPASDDPLPAASDMSSAIFTPDGTKIVTGDNLGRIRLWTASTGDPVRVIGQGPEGYNINWVVMTPDGKYVLGTRYGGIGVYAFDKTEAPEERVFNAPNAALFTAAISPDGTRVATGASDGRVFIWDFATGKLLFERREDRSQINSVNFSPDSKHLVTASSDRTIRVWDVETGASTLLLTGHDDLVLWAAYSADGQRIASSGFDATVKVWDAATGAELLSYTGPGKPFRVAVFNPDGTTLAAGGDDFRLYLWKLPEKNFANTPTAGPILKAQLDADDGKMLKEMLAWAPLTVSKPLSPTDRRDNFLEADPGVRTFDPRADACHQLAAFQSDPQRLAPGVRADDLYGVDAEAACRLALKTTPDDPRLHLQLGRALLVQDKTDEGRKEVQLAVDAGYPGAIYFLGLYLTDPSIPGLTTDDVKHGFELVRKAWDMGLADAGDRLAQFTLSGRKTDDGQEIIKQDEPAAIALYKQASEKGSWYSSNALAQKSEFGENGVTQDMLEALFYYALAARQVEVQGLVETTETKWSSYLFSRRASIARQLIRDGKSAEVAAVADRVSAWKMPADAPATPAGPAPATQ